MSHELPTGLRKAGIRGVVTMHDLIFIRYPELFPFIDRFFYQKKYRRAAEDADCIVAISEQTRQDLETFFQIPPARVRVIGQSCDPFFETLSLRHQPDRLALPLPQGVQIPEKDYFLAVGSLIPRKNWGRMFEALALLKKEGLDVPLVMVGTGKGAFADGLKAQAAQLGLSVFWLERHLPTRELALLCRRAAAMVYPSVFEGFGIPILEALTVGIPVVTSKGGCFEEVGGNAALYADPLSVEDIAAQMRRVLDSGVRNELIVNASEQVKLFSPEKICAAWMEVYQK